MVPLLFSLADVMAMIPKELQILPRLTTEQFSTLPQSIFDELWSREDGSVSGSCSQVASSLHDGALHCICGWHGELCSQ